MAKLLTGNGGGKYMDSQAKFNVINYILNPMKTPHHYHGFFDPANNQIHTYNLTENVPSIVQAMDNISISNNKADGVQLRHFYLSFAPNELWNYEAANAIGYQISFRFAKEFQTVYAVHEDTDHINIHFVLNSVRWTNGSRYYGTKGDHYKIMDTIGSVLRRYHIYRLEYVPKGATKNTNDD